MLNFGLKDRVVCVTGGASGIGRAGVLALARDGAHVGIIDLRQPEIDGILSEIREYGIRASGCALDVRDAQAIRRAADQFEQELGPVDGLFACAGISGAGQAESLEQDAFADVVDVNLIGVFLSCREFGGRMIKRRNGAIVVISSIDGIGGHAGRAHYVSSKHALGGLTRTLAIEWGRYGVRVNCIAPGLVDTPLLRASLPANFIEAVYDRTPLGRMGSAGEMAGIALTLLSDVSSYVTGQVLPIDGGLTAGFFTRKQGGDYSSKKLLAAGLYED